MILVERIFQAEKYVCQRVHNYQDHKIQKYAQWSLRPPQLPSKRLVLQIMRNMLIIPEYITKLWVLDIGQS